MREINAKPSRIDVPLPSPQPQIDVISSLHLPKLFPAKGLRSALLDTALTSPERRKPEMINRILRRGLAGV
jgi:hypothetical protein